MCVCLFDSVFELTRVDTYMYMYTEITYVYNWGEPERAPRSHDVYCTGVRACVPACLRTYVRVGEASLRASRGLAGNECSLGFGSLRTSA